MRVVPSDVTIDDVEFTLCTDCSDAFAVRDGWEGRCPSCCSVGDDHDAGGHDLRPVEQCRACEADDEHLTLPAIA